MKLGAIPVFIITVAITKLFIDIQIKQCLTILFTLFISYRSVVHFSLYGIKTIFYLFEGPGSMYVVLKGYLCLIALAMKNTSGKCMMKKFSSGNVMMGNTISLGIAITNYIKKNIL